MKEPLTTTPTKAKPESGKTTKPQFTSMQLENALAHAEHIMESCSLQFFLMDELCEYVVKNPPDTWLKQGSVDTITIGVRRHWVTPTTISTFQTIVPGWGTMPNEWQFDHQGVPIRVTLVNRDYKFLQNLDFKFHLASEYLVPNPFEKYWATRYLVK